MTLDEAKAFVLSARPYLSYVSNTGDGMSSFLREVLIKASTVARQVSFWTTLCLVVQIHVYLCGAGKKGICFERGAKTLAISTVESQTPNPYPQKYRQYQHSNVKPSNHEPGIAHHSSSSSNDDAKL